MGYWRGTFGKTAKHAAVALRIASAGSIVALLLGQAAIAAVLVYFTSVSGAGLPTRIASAAAPFLLFPVYFLVLLPGVIAETDAARQAEIDALKDRVAELQTEDSSDASLQLVPSYTVHINTEHPSRTMHSYGVSVENRGPNHLLNCVLKIGTMNKFNADIHTRAWLHDASPTFELRRVRTRCAFDGVKDDAHRRVCDERGVGCCRRTCDLGDRWVASRQERRERAERSEGE